MAVDFYLEIEGIKGESHDSKHKDWIDLQSWSWGESQQGSQSFGGGAGSGKVTMQDFHFVMNTNKASPPLMAHCASGKHIAKAKMEANKAGGAGLEGGDKYVMIEFEDLMISSFQTGGSSGQEIPLDQISFNYAKINYTYYTQDNKDGTMKATPPFGWNLKENKKA